LYKSGAQLEKLNYKMLADRADHREFFKEMIENVYRYEQFYGNTFLALLFCSILRYLVGNAAIIQSKSDMVIFGALLGSSVTLFLAGRNTLTNVSRAIHELSH
jgi:hypothetical protein